MGSTRLRNSLVGALDSESEALAEVPTFKRRTDALIAIVTFVPTMSCTAIRSPCADSVLRSSYVRVGSIGPDTAKGLQPFSSHLDPFIKGILRVPQGRNGWFHINDIALGHTSITV